ncbi:MAG: metallophosphoesterase [Myxococcales bacterium]|nr:metallophosphoesterase [Myxococcales bacterium]
MTTLAHLSDMHSTRVRVDRLRDFLGKRALAWISWNLRRHRTHSTEILRALAADVRDQKPGQVVVTGDITNASLDAEFSAVADWLRENGDPGWLTAVPGNHDAFARDSIARVWHHWAPYVSSDDAGRRAHPTVPDRDFPTLRIRDGLALVGVCSARPSLPGLARGRIGADQMLRLEALLHSLRESDLCRVVLTHYPPFDDGLTWRRRLRDSTQLREVLERTGADLVLHGHLHRACFRSIPGPDGDIRVVGVPSASHVGGDGRQSSGYHVYRIGRRTNGEARPRYAISVQVRGYDPVGGRFVTEFERDL